jgi:hypothetical protein
LTLSRGLAIVRARERPRIVDRAPEQAESDPVQLHLVLAYRHELREHPRVRSFLERGFRVVQLQRVTDREVLVTLSRGTPDGAQGPRAR